MNLGFFLSVFHYCFVRDKFVMPSPFLRLSKSFICSVHRPIVIMSQTRVFTTCLGWLHSEADLLEAVVPADQGEAGRAVGELDLPPGQEHPHHRHPEGQEPQGQGHQRKIRSVKLITSLFWHLIVIFGATRIGNLNNLTKATFFRPSFKIISWCLNLHLKGKKT